MKIYYYAFLMEIRKVLAYRFDFWINFIGQTFFKLILSVYLWKNIFEASGKTIINGYNFDRIVLYYIVTTIIFKVQQSGIIGTISNEIYNGTLNKFLLYPINFFLFKISTFLGNAIIYLFQLGIILYLYYNFYSDSAFKPDIYFSLFFVLTIILGGILYFYMNAICELIAFWADNIWSLGVMLRMSTAFFAGVMVPISFFPGWALKLLKYSPYPYLIDLPMKIFFQNTTYDQLLRGIIAQISWIFIFAIISKLIWIKGRYKYTGVGI